MVQFCCVQGCGNRSNRERNKLYFRLPTVPKKCDKLSFKADLLMARRKQWLMNINREDLKEDGDAAYSRGYIKVCSDHFISGKPSAWSDVENIDWAPTIRMNYDPKQRRRFLKSLAGSKIHPTRGMVQSTTPLRRKLKAQELKTKKEILQLLKQESDSEHSEETAEERITEHPIIHKITSDCIIKQETDSNQNVNEMEDILLLSAKISETEAISEFKVKAEFE